MIFLPPLADICGGGPPLFCFLERIFLLSIGELDFFGRNTLQNYHHRHQRSEQRKEGKNHPLYYNTLGTESSHPFKGINIMVTTHTDGTTTAKKILH